MARQRRRVGRGRCGAGEGGVGRVQCGVGCGGEGGTGIRGGGGGGGRKKKGRGVGSRRSASKMTRRRTANLLALLSSAAAGTALRTHEQTVLYYRILFARAIGERRCPVSARAQKEREDVTFLFLRARDEPQRLERRSKSPFALRECAPASSPSSPWCTARVRSHCRRHRSTSPRACASASSTLPSPSTATPSTPPPSLSPSRGSSSTRRAARARRAGASSSPPSRLSRPRTLRPCGTAASSPDARALEPAPGAEAERGHWAC